MESPSDLADTLQFPTESHFAYLEKLKELFEAAQLESEDETLMEVMFVYAFTCVLHHIDRSSLETLVAEGLASVAAPSDEDDHPKEFH